MSIKYFCTTIFNGCGIHCKIKRKAKSDTFTFWSIFNYYIDCLFLHRASYQYGSLASIFVLNFICLCNGDRCFSFLQYINMYRRYEKKTQAIFFSEFGSIWRVLRIVSLELKHIPSCMIAQNLLDLGYFYQPSNLHHAIDIVVMLLMLCMII